jgi:hypothetical protein
MLNSILAAVTQRGFLNERQIREFARDRFLKDLREFYKSETGTERQLSLDDFRATRIYAAEKRQLWLVVGGTRVFCFLDDRRREVPQYQWEMPIDDAVQMKVETDWSEEAGAIQFGNRTDYVWYSKDLFFNEPVTATISRFLLSNRRDVEAR